MIKVVPQAFFTGQHPFEHLYHDGQNCLLYKQLETPNLQHDYYVACHVLTIVLKGKKVMTSYDGTTVTVNEGQLVFVPKDLYMIQDIIAHEGLFESWLFFFSDELMQQFIDELKSGTLNGHHHYTEPLSYLPVYEYTPELQVYTSGLLQILNSMGKGSSQYMRIKLKELLHLMAMGPHKATFLQAAHAMKPRKRNIKTFMEANYDKPFKVEDYAQLTGRSLTSFMRDFKQMYGTTPKQWLKKQKLQRAHNLLEGGQKSVTEVAYDVGYENLSHFIKAFKDVYQVSPKQFVISQRNASF